MLKFNTLENQTYDLNTVNGLSHPCQLLMLHYQERISKSLKSQKSVSMSQAISLVLELKPPNRRLNQGKQVKQRQSFKTTKKINLEHPLYQSNDHTNCGILFPFPSHGTINQF